MFKKNPPFQYTGERIPLQGFGRVEKKERLRLPSDIRRNRNIGKVCLALLGAAAFAGTFIPYERTVVGKASGFSNPDIWTGYQAHVGSATFNINDFFDDESTASNRFDRLTDSNGDQLTTQRDYYWTTSGNLWTHKVLKNTRAKDIQPVTGYNSK